MKTGLCQMHYHRQWRHGDVNTVLPQPRTQSPEEYSYRRAHTAVAWQFGIADLYPCVECGSPAAEWAYDGTDPSQKTQMVRIKGVEYPVTYSVWPEFYMPMCIPCHRWMDSQRRNHEQG